MTSGRRARLFRARGGDGAAAPVAASLGGCLVFLLFLEDMREPGALTLGGVYHSKPEAEAALTRVPFPSRYSIQAITVDLDLFTTLAAGKVERAEPSEPDRQT